MRELLKEYRQTYREIKKLRLQVASRPWSEQNEHDLSLISSMERDVEWVVSYLENGCEPDARRGAARRLIVLDPAVLERVMTLQALPAGGGRLTDEQRQQLDAALDVLSEAEREVLQLVLGEGLTHAETADLLGMSKGNVSTLIARAQAKLSQRQRPSWQKGMIKVVRAIRTWEPKQPKMQESPAARRSKFVGR